MIKINNIEIPIYPSNYDDDPVTIKTDSFSINGSMERHKFPSKKQVQMEFPAANPAQVSFFREIFEAPGTVEFFNDQSNHGILSFTGIMTTCQTGEYTRGGSFLAPLKVVIREA